MLLDSLGHSQRNKILVSIPLQDNIMNSQQNQRFSIKLCDFSPSFSIIRFYMVWSCNNKSNFYLHRLNNKHKITFSLYMARRHKYFSNSNSININNNYSGCTGKGRENNNFVEEILNQWECHPVNVTWMWMWMWMWMWCVCVSLCSIWMIDNSSDPSKWHVLELLSIHLVK